MRQGCLVLYVCCVHGRDMCVGCGGRRGQDAGGAWNVRKPRRWLREEKGPMMAPIVCVPAPGGTGKGWGRCACCSACMVYLARGNSVAGCCQARGWVRCGVLGAATRSLAAASESEVRRIRCVLCGAVLDGVEGEWWAWLGVGCGWVPSEGVGSGW